MYLGEHETEREKRDKARVVTRESERKRERGERMRI